MKRIYWNIKQKMDEKGFTQLSLAKELGITQATVSDQLRRLKRGEGVQTSTLEKILEKLNMRLEVK